jgi:hypothetical protein
MEDDKILLRIKRKYTKDEEIGLLVQKLKDVEVELGQYKSENAELLHQLKNDGKAELLNEIKGLRKTVSNLTKKINENPWKKELAKKKKENRELLEKYLSLNLKFNKLNNNV